MRFVIYGAGGIGCAIGARLFLSRQDVLLIARGAHLDALRAQGLRFITPTQDVRLPVPVAGHPAEAALRDDDVVMLCVKSHQTEAALRALRDAAGDATPLVCCQNGVANERMALRRFGRVYGMVVILPAEHLVPGEVVHAAEGPAGILDVGRYPTGEDDIAQAIAAALEKAGFSARADVAIMRQKHAKLLANLGNAVQAACNDAPREIMRLLRAEALACYAAAGIDSASAKETRARRAMGIRAVRVPGREPHRGSSWQSVRRGAGNIETDYLNGEIVQLGRLHNVPTPVNLAVQRIGNRIARDGLPAGSYSAAALMRAIEAEGAATPSSGAARSNVSAGG